MSLKVCDIVLIVPLQKQGMVMSYAYDITTKSNKYVININDQEPDCICRPEDIRYISSLDDEVQGMISGQKINGKA